MKTLKKLASFAMITLLVSGSVTVKAQQAPATNRIAPPKQNAEQRFEMFCNRLGLNEQQRVQMKEIAKSNREEMMKIREAKKGAPHGEKRAAILAQLKKVDDQIDAILMPDQKQNYMDFKRERKEQREARIQERRKMKNTGGEQLEENPF
jgi:Spy/CpxP family protein refolding chaperone